MLQQYEQDQYPWFTDQVSKVLGDSYVSFLIANLLSTVIFSTSMMYMWGLVNTLQIVVLTVLFDIKTPLNVQETFLNILKLANFDLIQLDSFYDSVFTFTPSEPFNELFLEAEYDTSNYIKLIGPIFIFVSLYLIFIPVTISLRKVSSINKLVNKTWMRQHAPNKMKE